MKKLLFTFLAALYCMVMNAQDVTFTADGIIRLHVAILLQS